jgi:hypothetical protein
MAEMRNYATSNFVVDIAGQQIGQCFKFDPPKMTLDVAQLKAGSGNDTFNTVANLKYGEASMEVGASMGKGLSDWVQSAFNKQHIYKDGSCVIAGPDFKAQRRINWLQALVTEVGLPALDASSKDAAKFTIKFTPEVLRWEKAGGEVITAPPGTKVKPFVASNFRVEIGDLLCKNIVKVDAMSFKVKTTVDAVGERKENDLIPTAIEHPELKLTIQRKDEDAWATAFKKWAIDGQSHQEHELSGRIVYLAHDMSTELGELQIARIGFKEMSFAAMERSDKGATFTVSMYIEDLKLVMKVFDQ